MRIVARTLSVKPCANTSSSLPLKDQAAKIIAQQTAQNFTKPKFPFEIPSKAKQDATTATVDSVLYFCNDEKEKICLVDSVRVNVPLEVPAGATKQTKIEVAVKARGANN